MGYWIPSDLAAILPMPNLGVPLLGPSTNPWNITKSQTLIDEISGHVDSAIAAAGYGAPVPSGPTPAWEYIRLVTQAGLRWRILQDMGSASAAQADRDFYLAQLNLISTGKMPLPGAPGDTGESGRILPRWSGEPTPMIYSDSVF